MSLESSKTEEELYQDGLTLLSNGHRMTYIFKYIRERSDSDELRQRVMQRLTSNDDVQKINETRRDALTQTKGPGTTQLIIGISLIAFSLFLTVMLWNAGWVSTIPLIICAYVLINWAKGKN
jgi:hypothetical protein